jgi:hypothetical protein
MKWESSGAFLSWLLRREIFLTGFFLSEFHCSNWTNGTLTSLNRKEQGNSDWKESRLSCGQKVGNYCLSMINLSFCTRFVYKNTSQIWLWYSVIHTEYSVDHSEDSLIHLLYMKMRLLKCERTNTFILLLIKKYNFMNVPHANESGQCWCACVSGITVVHVLLYKYVFLLNSSCRWHVYSEPKLSFSVFIFFFHVLSFLYFYSQF